MSDWEEIGNQTFLRAEDRRNEIVEELLKEKKVTVNDLSEKFNVSTVTIRGDLDWLERNGKLKRVRGGAVILDRMTDVADISKRMTTNSELKKRIASVASGLISDGDSVIIDSGSTTFELVKALDEKMHLMLLTQDITIASYVDQNLRNASVVMLGGALRPRHGYCWGPLTVNTINQLHVDKAFLGTNGFVAEQGFMTENPYSSETKHAFIQHAQRSIVLMDSTKVSVHSFIQFASLNEIDCIVMDDDPDGIMKKACSLADPAPELLLA
jgi:DeoR family fructose operon transcriptional repressor